MRIKLPKLMFFAPLKTNVSSCFEQNNLKSNELKIATFNVSFATDNDPSENYKRWIKYFSYTNKEQNKIINKWKKSLDENKLNLLTNEEKQLAEKLIQIRNVTAIIQHNCPDILVLNEFNNDGNGDKETMLLYQRNYLEYPQSLNSIDGGNMQKPIRYSFLKSFATNTGLNSGLDLNNDGKIENKPENCFGFGYYHGHYAFGLMSMYEIDDKNIRTFQNFLWKDMKELDGITPVSIPRITEEGKMPNNMKLGDNWFSAEKWEKIRLSSKNHVDVPIKINNRLIHLLISHPTPPVFDGVAKINLARNRDEILFWKHYLDNKKFIYDDQGNFGGINAKNDSFLILGDINSDNFDSDNYSKTREGIKFLTSSNFVNQEYVDGKWVPTSKGAKEQKENDGSYKYNHIKPEARTSTFGLRVDWVLPSIDLEIKDTGVYWVGKNEPGYLLFNDKRIGKYGNSKEISSDHCLVWTTIKVN